MIKVTFEQDGAPNDVETGKFVLAVIGNEGKENLLCVYGTASNTDLMKAISTSVGRTIENLLDPEDQKRAYKVLRAIIDTEIKRLEAKETPEAATSEESGK